MVVGGETREIRLSEVLAVVMAGIDRMKHLIAEYESHVLENMEVPQTGEANRAMQGLDELSQLLLDAGTIIDSLAELTPDHMAVEEKRVLRGLKLEYFKNEFSRGTVISQEVNASEIFNLEIEP